MSLNGIAIPFTNGKETPLKRADEVDDLLNAVQLLIVPFIRSADEDAVQKHTGHGLAVPGGGPRTALVEHHNPAKLVDLMKLDLPGEGKGKEGLLETVEQVLRYSVNTWDQGFLDKLYASTNAVGVISELILAVLNTNLHVFQVSPALTVIEKTTAKQLASLFGLTGSHAGGISTQGGSASNFTSLIIARNALFRDSKTSGNGNHRFALFTSDHGHYSLEKAAQMCGMGTDSVLGVPVDEGGRMIPSELDSQIEKAKKDGKTPLYVNATAGTTVLGSFDPFTEISAICKKHNIWFHIDGSWGGPVVFSMKQKHKMAGSQLADSIAVNPHKMLGTPVTCSFLLGPDLRVFHRANTLPAEYLFHGGSTDGEVWDLADLTLQCGRRGDSLKLALSWIYYGSSGYETQIDNAFLVASYFASEISSHPDFVLVSENPPPCLQVCFYYTKDGSAKGTKGLKELGEALNTNTTSRIVQSLIPKGFMVDYAPGEYGKMFRVVVNIQTRQGTIDGLIKAIVDVGGRF
ncbi:glutamate decarboxylase-like protein-like protein 1 [Calycina marina]|uniref:Glutamate decarboxylase-like protein-like protein 1 n=1 Tax=Calycina marina TaxID=1763456 RepID=A0A9P7Z2K3_9HELO|nr:glutamate decarboxylase-like protein-like protein 1 [Calycina marina]